MKQRVELYIRHHVLLIHQHDIIHLPHCPNNESPTLWQSASCAETGLLHCHPFKLQSRTKCENDRVVQISALWCICAFFFCGFNILHAHDRQWACSFLTSLAVKAGRVNTLSMLSSFIDTHSKKTRPACGGRDPLGSLNDANNANTPFPEQPRNRCCNSKHWKSSTRI